MARVSAQAILYGDGSDTRNQVQCRPIYIMTLYETAFALEV